MKAVCDLMLKYREWEDEKLRTQLMLGQKSESGASALQQRDHSQEALDKTLPSVEQFGPCSTQQ